MKLEGRVAVITGASSGIGRATATKMYHEGAEIAVCDINYEAASNLVSELTKIEGKKVFATKLDVANFEEVGRKTELIKNQFHRIDILVNSAGITRASMFHKMTEQQWDEVINVHLKGTFNMCRHVAPIMREQGYGKIINISSTSYMGNIGQANYAAAKGGIISLTKTLALELARHKINVNVIAPGAVDTPMFVDVPEKIKKMYIDRIPLSRMAEPLEIADLIVFLASEESRYITGELIHIDGGMTVGE